MDTHLFARVARFVLVGVVSAATYYSLYLLLGLAAPYLLAHVLALGIAVIASYFLHCRYTFRTPPSLRGMLLFPLSNATNFLVSTAVLYLMVDTLAVSHYIAPVIGAAVALPATFLIAQFAVTNSWRPKPTGTADHGDQRDHA